MMEMPFRLQAQGWNAYPDHEFDQLLFIVEVTPDNSSF